MSNRSALPLILTAMFLLASALALVGPVEEILEEPTALKAEPVVQSATSPGHVVFAQYITSDNCPYCYQYGSPAHHSIKTQYPNDYVYISYQSVSYGDTDTARAGAIQPYNWPWSTSGAPDAYFGDRLDQRVSGCGSNTCYDQKFAAGGGMTAGTTSQYTVMAQAGANGSNIDITIGAQYTGSGSPASNSFLYAALTEETCNSYVYSDGSKGHNCWKAWLTDGGTYKAGNGGGGGTAFVQPTLTGGNVATASWSVPANLVNGGVQNALVVVALMTGGPSSGSNSEHVLTAADSGMMPLVDVGVSQFSATNQAGGSGFVPGDVVDLSVTVQNNGAEAYSDGGTIGFYYLQGNQEHQIATTSLNSLTKGGSSDTQSWSTTFDTSSLSVTAHGQTMFRARLTGLTGDGNVINNFAQEGMAHDVPPSATLPVAAAGDTVITRQPGDTSIDFELKPSLNDAVDDVSSMTGALEVKDIVTGEWSASWVTGGDQVFGQGDGAHLKFTVTPPTDAKAGDYDVRTMWTDSRSQSSAWIEYSNAFSLMNGLPAVTDGVVPTVKVDSDERISLVGIVEDPETPLNQLDITSSANEFLGWFPDDMEIGVRFASADQNRDAAGNYMQQNLQITMDDGTDSNTGTIKINLIENGAPRWAPVQAVTIEEGGTASVALAQYLSDTDDSGQPALVSDLTVQVIGNDADNDIITTTVNGQTLVIQTVDDDAFGSTLLTLRAHDGVRHSDTEMMVHVTNVNDAPRLDATPFDGLRIKAGQQTWIDMSGRITDVDTDDENLWIDVSSDVARGAKWFPGNETLRLDFPVAGMKTFSFTLDDNEGGVDTIPITIEVVDALPLTWEQNGVGDLSIATDTLDTGSSPRVTILNVGQTTLTEVEVSWALCNTISGQCTDYGFETEFGAFDVVPQSGLGLRQGDQIKVDVLGVDSEGFDRKSTETKVFDAVEAPDAPDAVDDATTDGSGDDGASAQSEEGMSLSSPMAIGGIVLVLLLALTLALTFVMRGGKRDDLILSAYAQQLVEQGYEPEVAQAHASLYEQHAAEGATAAPAAPAAPTTVADYTHLPAGGDYRTGYHGETIYVEPSGVAWTMQADNSFIRSQ